MRPGIGGDPAAFTVKVKDVVLVIDPPTAVTVIVEFPTGVVPSVEIVSVVVQVGEHEVGENDAVAFVGRPDAEKVVF